MREDFAILIITHKRPDSQFTLKAVRQAGYTGKIILVMDDEDETLERYKELYGGENVRLFHKDDITFDTMDNFYKKKNVPSIARNACWEIAKKENLKYFLMMDDDYPGIQFRHEKNGKMKSEKIRNFDRVIDAFLKYMEDTEIVSLSFAVDGDYIGGTNPKVEQGIWIGGRNTYFCSTDRQYEFKGRSHEDLTTTKYYSSIGKLFFTIAAVKIAQTRERASGGSTEYNSTANGYTKCFYTVIAMPSAVQLVYRKKSFENRVNSNAIFPKIINEKWRKSL